MIPLWFLLYLWSHKAGGNYQQVSPIVITPAPMQVAGPGVVDTRCRPVMQGKYLVSVCP